MDLSADPKHLLLVVVVVSLLAVAGLGVLGGGSGPDGPDYPAVIDNTTASLSAENESAFLSAITDDSGELTTEGEAWADRLETVEAVGPAQRDAVARSMATGGVSEQRLARLDGILAAPPDVTRTVLRDGLRDSSGDGLLDGETRLLGLDRTERYPTVSTAARTLSAGGYDNRSIRYLDRLSTHTDSAFRLAQIRGLGLVNDSVANGSVTAADRRAITDGSGDGLLDGTAEAFGLDPAEQHTPVVALATPLADAGYTETELAYLRRIGALTQNRSMWAQAASLGLLEATAATGSVDQAAVEQLQSTDAGLLAGFEAKIGVTNRTDRAMIGKLAARLADTGYDETALSFLERAANITESSFQYEQARALSLLTEPVRDGRVTAADSAALTDSSGDGLLDPMAARLGAEESTANPRLRELAEPLGAGGYNETELAYLDRLEELSAYRGNEYERWAQARQLGLLDSAVENGTVTESQLWQLGNEAPNRLLNGMEREFGTDPDRADTSGDGYPDHLVWGPMRDLGLTVTPTEPDVYVEVDTVRSQTPPSDRQLREVSETFRSEPTDDSINVHFFRCDADQGDVSGISEMQRRVDQYRTVTGLGFQYLLVKDGSIEFDGEAAAGVAYVSRHDPSWMMIDGTLSERATPTHESSAIAHELGHSLGITNSAFDGVDSTRYSPERYNSVMGYNLWTPITFSTGPPFDDYQRMADRSFGSFHQNHDALEEMWQNGSVTKELSCTAVEN
ncbi:hypothetical protein [Halovenus sp. HT40]|uniref:hypothetical protein n=1 Tax=Halovenus sp. HT40 TaxID=3126691 RepID=UPI00300F5CD8